MWVPHGKELTCFFFSDRADDGEATTLESGVCSGMCVRTWLMSVCETRGSGICQQVGTTTVQKGIRCLRNDLPTMPGPALLPSSFPVLFSPCGWRGGGQVSRCNASQTAQPRRPKKGRERPWQWQEGRERHTGKVWICQWVEHLHPSWAGSATTPSWTRPAFYTRQKARSCFQLAGCSGVQQGALG